jgi:hypothetical protein
MKSGTISTTPTSSSGRINRRIRTSVLHLSRNLYGDHGRETNQWFLSYVNRYLDGVWTQGQLDIQGTVITFHWNEKYQVEMREIYRERMVNNVLSARGEHTGCTAH